MTREQNEATLRSYCDAWQAGNAAAIMALYSDDFTLHYFGQSQFAGDHVGKAAALGTLMKIGQLTNRKLLDVHDIIASETHGTILAHESFERDGRTMETHRVFVYHFRDGQMTECWLYDEDQRAVDEFWA